MEILNTKINVIKKNIKLVVIFIACYALGLIIGLIFGERSVCFPLYDVACGRYICILDVYTSVFSIFFKKIFSSLLILCVAFLLGLNRFTSFFSAVIFFCRGLVLGSLFYIFWSNYFISGLFIYIFIICVQNIIITAGMIVAVVLNYDIADKSFSCKVKELIFNFIISFGVCIVGALYELLILVLILRPLLTCF